MTRTERGRNVQRAPGNLWLIGMAALVGILGLSGCTTEQAYRSGQAWQQNQCNKSPDKAEAERCMGQATTPYESYRKQSGADSR